MNLATLSPEFPLEIPDEEYDQLVKKKDKGWSHCESMNEWMAKLHYLRTGYKAGKLQPEDFFKREQDLILNWWALWC